MKKNTLFSLTALAAVAAGVVLAVCCSPAGRKTGPCDIYAQGGTPCVTAHSTTRLLYSRYKGPLYRVERDSDGASIDIRATKAGRLPRRDGGPDHRDLRPVRHGQ